MSTSKCHFIPPNEPRHSSLPGLSFAGDPERYPLRNEVIDYLKGYASHFSLPVMTNSQVITVNKIAIGFDVQTANGQQYSAQTLISATGAFANPYWPQLVGESSFQGQILHSASYQNPASFKNQRVIVVGAGNSAVQIATELAEVADVTIASRQPIKFVPQRILGKDVHFLDKNSRLRRMTNRSMVDNQGASQRFGPGKVSSRASRQAARVQSDVYPCDD